MDRSLKDAVRLYVADPVETTRAVADAALKRSHLPLTGHVEAIRTVAGAIIRLVEAGRTVDESTLAAAHHYQNMPYGSALNESHDDIMLCDWLYTQLPHPLTLEDVVLAFGPVLGEDVASVYDAMQSIAACENCNQYVRGCICGQTCPDCGDPACYGECMQGYPYVVGSGYGGQIAIWVHQDPAQCGCGGSGWSTTDYDSVHQCPAHYTGQPHPEEY